MKKAFSLIIITGKRWFQRTYGNTYYSVSIEIRHAKKETVYLQSGIHYGYGDQYRQTAAAMLIKAGYFTNDDDFFIQSVRNDKTRAKFIFYVSDVAREKDLK